MKVLAWPAPDPSLLNPYINLIYSEFPKLGARVAPYHRWTVTKPQAEVFHVHWPEAIFWGRLTGAMPPLAHVAAQRLLASMRYIRRGGGVVVWTAHNLVPLQPTKPFDQNLWQSFFAAFRQELDLIISLSTEANLLLRQRYPDLASVESIVIPHPHYRSAYSRPPSQEQSRHSLGLPPNKLILGMIGVIRASKGIVEGVKAFCGAARPDELLLVAGPCNDRRLQRELLAAAAHDDRIQVLDKPIANSLLPSYLAACDAILLNQTIGLNSGSLLLALSMNRPAIAPSQGSATGTARLVGDHWVMTFDETLTAPILRSKLDRIVARRLNVRADAEHVELDWFDPAAVSRLTYNGLSRALLHRTPQSSREPRA